jgi:hypothetical protein
MDLPMVHSTDSEAIRKCLLTGFFENIAVLGQDGDYKTKIDNKEVSIHPSSVLFQKKIPCVIYNELVMKYLRLVDNFSGTYFQEIHKTCH